MKPMIIALMMVLGIGIAVADAEPEAKPEAKAEADPDKERGFRLPPGFKEMKRGKFVLYCKREAAMGTRVKTETCFDEKQMRDYLLALETGKVDIDRTRAICSNPCICGMPC